MIALDKVNEEFCKEIGIQPVSGCLINKDTNELRLYNRKSSLYKLPKGWANVDRYSFTKPIYPDFTSPNNFMKLLEAHWFFFGSFGGQVYRVSDESFVNSFLSNDVLAMRAMTSLGGSESLNDFKDCIKNLDYEWELPCGVSKELIKE